MQGQDPWKELPFSPQTYEMFSWLLQRLPGSRTQLLSHVNTLATFAIEQVQRHQGSLDPSGPARDVVDAFLLKMAKVREGGGLEALLNGYGGLAACHPGVSVHVCAYLFFLMHCSLCLSLLLLHEYSSLLHFSPLLPPTSPPCPVTCH